MAKQRATRNKTDDTNIRERVKKPPSAVFVDSYFAPRVAREIAYNFDSEMQLNLAHGLMLARQGIIAKKDMRKILKVVLKVMREGPEALGVDHKVEDLYSYTERHIIQALGPEVGGRLHTGRSRNDLHTTTWRMALRENLLAVLDVLAELRATTLKLAAQYIETVMPGYTHSQHAQPITLGYYLLTFADVLARDFSRIEAGLARTDQSPLGSGALTTTAFPLDRNYTAKALGFDGVLEIAYDGVSNRDDALEAGAALSILMTNISRLAFDLQSWNTLEYQFIELGDEHSSVSSIMPQKKNPSSMEHAKGVAAVVAGDFMAALSCVKNTSMSDVGDGVTALNEPVLDACTRTRKILAVMTEVLESLTVHEDAMLRSAEVGFGSATELSDVIVRETGLSFRMAHNIVGNVVRKTVAAGKTALDIAAKDLDAASRELFDKPLKISAKAVADALDPAKNIQVRTLTGGPAPKTMKAMIVARKKVLSADKKSVNAVKSRVAKAREKLLKDAKAFVSGKAAGKAA